MQASLPKNDAEVFLATTALEEFWDKTKPLVFLGSWCQKYERRPDWESLPNSELLPTPYGSPDDEQRAYLRVEEIYERCLPLLAAKLNAIHGLDCGIRFWRILLGPWLQLYLPATYDRYLHIKHAQASHPEFTTLTLSEKSFTVASDTLDFACALSEDSYNLQIFTKILFAMGLVFPCKEMPVPQNPLYGKLLSNPWKRRAISKVVRLYANLCARVRQTVLLRNAYFSKSAEIKLALTNFAGILPMWEQSAGRPPHKFDEDKRKSLQYLGLGDSEYEKCLSAMLYSDLPQCFIEQFDAIGKEASQLYPERVNAVFSANAWYYDEAFKRWAASLAERGTLLLGTQHGGNYGALKNMASENHETAIIDRYYSWGWHRTDCSATVVAMPASKLVGRDIIGADNQRNGILWVATSGPRYLFQYPFVPIHFEDYLAWQQRFAKSLNQRSLASTRFRPHYESYGWGITDRLRDSIPDIRIESWDVPFPDSLINCRLYVCDHLSTTFVEALAANKPTILFWNPQTNALRADAQPYYDLLRSSGILFDTPEAAAQAIANVYDDVESWWNAADRQQVVSKFCNQFARTSPNALALWSIELKRAAMTSQHLDSPHR